MCCSVRTSAMELTRTKFVAIVICFCICTHAVTYHLFFRSLHTTPIAPRQRKLNEPALPSGLRPVSPLTAETTQQLRGAHAAVAPVGSVIQPDAPLPTSTGTPLPASTGTPLPTSPGTPLPTSTGTAPQAPVGWLEAAGQALQTAADSLLPQNTAAGGARGRCGPKYEGRVCDCTGDEMYCNESSGWCGSASIVGSRSTAYDCMASPKEQQVRISHQPLYEPYMCAARRTAGMNLVCFVWRLISTTCLIKSSK